MYGDGGTPMYRIIESSPGPNTITSPMIDGLRAPYLAVGGMDLKLST
ncbi:uncharacterized protein PADG_11184 [Paracoccidioides brasiliensis Pb18]|uniref:Uncharacterized protein n=2 Tax=Paracoccidioides brasiliensis TaxID=121759 RepID=A0A0A0HXF7_PARBD|nr:uncharacterized protein PADG_11184 [Paracoccidioides brasiliensis Pb18]KGM92726.1 hypothetical protein PADG_11184 [Paracoccidioides brasiliensis Pb18]ODH12555.1 hypothetical protein ACO22_08149 [Paracoccidioides brasiliensis]